MYGFYCNKCGVFTEKKLMELKKVLRDLLNKNNVKVTELSRATKVPVQSIRNWLEGVSPRRLDHVLAVATYFEVSIEFLITGKQKEIIKDFQDEINAGVFEVVLRRPKKSSQES